MAVHVLTLPCWEAQPRAAPPLVAAPEVPLRSRAEEDGVGEDRAEAFHHRHLGWVEGPKLYETVVDVHYGAHEVSVVPGLEAAVGCAHEVLQHVHSRHPRRLVEEVEVCDLGKRADEAVTVGYEDKNFGLADVETAAGRVRVS